MNPSLRNVLYFDAATCTGTGLVLASLAAPLSPMLGLPYALLQCAGLVLLPVAGFMVWVATREHGSPWGVSVVLAGNAAWVLASVLVLALLAPTRLGYGFVAAQAVLVSVLAVLEYKWQRHDHQAESHDRLFT